MKKIKYNLFLMGLVFIIGILIVETNIVLEISSEELRFLNYIKVLILSGIAYFIPMVIKMLFKYYNHASEQKELRYLKKLFVLCGSVKPMDYNKTIKTLIFKAEIYKKDLEFIHEAHKKSNVDTTVLYTQMMKENKNIEIRLFFEKLDLAANYDLDEAILNISNDFIQEKRTHARRVKKKIELINIVGITGVFVILAVLLLYMLGPWMEMLNLQNIF